MIFLSDPPVHVYLVIKSKIVHKISILMQIKEKSFYTEASINDIALISIKMDSHEIVCA